MKRLQKRLPGQPSDSLPAYPSPVPTSNDSHLALKILLSKEIFVAGERVTGQLELNITSKTLALGELAIEFDNLNELRSLDHTAVRKPVEIRCEFQGKLKGPSNAVVPGSRPINGEYYPAVPGRIRFPFSIELPSGSASTCALGGNATNRYELRAIVSAMTTSTGSVSRQTTKKDVTVFERWADWDVGNWTKGVEKRAAGALKLGGDGRLEICASVGMEGGGRLFWRRELEAGVEGKSRIEARVRVRNSSKRTVSGIRVSLCRRLRVISQAPARGAGPAPLITAEIVHDTFRGIGFEFAAGEERQVIVHCDVPPKVECWTVRKSQLFELDVFVKVQVECGFLAKDLYVELSVWIAHPRSLPSQAHAQPTQHFVPTPTLPASQPFPRSPSFNEIPAGQATFPLSSAAVYDPYNGQQPQQAQQPYFNEFGAAPPHQRAPYHSQPQPPMQNYHHSISSSPAPASYSPFPPPVQFPLPPPPPHSDPYRQSIDHYQQHFAEVNQGQQQYYYGFDPSAPDLTTSQFINDLNGSPAAPSAPSASYEQQQYHQQGYMDVSLSGRSTHRGPEKSTSTPPPITSAALSPEHHHASTLLPPSQAAPTRSPSPDRPTSARGMHSPSHSPSTSPTPFENQSPPPAAYNSGISLQRSHSSQSVRSLRTPPPPAPSSRFQAPTTPNANPLFSQTLPVPTSAAELLETIGEDGESQAGTTKSVALAAQLRSASFDDAEIRKPQANSPGRSSIQELEDFVEDEGKMKDLVSDERDGSLPIPVPTKTPPDVPSDRTKPSKGVLPSARDIFAPAASADSPPDLPAKSLSPPPISRSPVPPRDAHGLTALEALLKRPITPDRPRTASPVQRALSPPAMSQRPLSPPTVLGRPKQLDSIALPVATGLRAKSISRARSGKNLAEQMEKEDSREMLRRAMAAAPSPPISSVATPPVSSVTPPIGDTVSAPPTVSPPRERTISTPMRATKPPSPERPSPPKAPVRAETTPILPSSTSASLLPATDQYVEGTKVVDVQEVKAIKKDAAGRIGNWLLKSDPKITVPPKVSPSRASMAKEVVKSPSFARVATPPPSPPTSAAKPAATVVAEPTVEELLESEPASSPVLSRSTSLGAPDVLSKYDVKSARGGRGGVVSSVANLWAGKLVDVEERTKSPPPLTMGPPKALRVGPGPLSPVSNLAARIPPPATRPISSSGSPAAPSSSPAPFARNNRWSAPTPAKPFINSTVGKTPVLSQPRAGVASPSRAASQSKDGALQPVVKVNDGIARLIARYSADVKSLT